MASEKLRKIAKIVKEITIEQSQSRYDISGLSIELCKFFYRKPQELFQDLSSGDYTIDTSNKSKTLVIQNPEILKIAEAIQVCYVVDLTSSRYEAEFNIDINKLNSNYNQLVDDVHTLWEYIKKVGMIADDTTIPLILPQLNTDEVWVKTEDGYKGISLTDAEGIIKGVIEEYTSLMEKRLDAYVEDPLKPRLNEHVETVNKPELDRYVEETNKPALDDYTTQLEERLQTMIDQAVADKGLMPEDSDWFEIALGNWLVVDLFNKNYIHYPSQLNSSDNAGVVKKDITDGGKSQILRYYTTTGKIFFAVRVNEVWSEWQELGEQTDTMQFTQPNHEFVFTAVTLDGTTRKWVKANKYTSADGIAIKIDNDRFDVVTRGVVNIPTQARDDKGNAFVYDEYYFLSQEVDGGLSRTKNEIGTFQYLAHISEIGGKQVAYIDIGDSYDLDYEVVDTETADRVGIGTYKTTLRTADTIEDLKRLNLKAGDVVEVLGYYIKGDGADHKRKIESSDDGSGILLNNGLYANIVHNGKILLTWFGAKDNITYDSTNEYKKFFGYMKTNPYCKFIIPDGTYVLNEYVYIPSNITLVIDGLMTPNKQRPSMAIETFDRITETPGYTASQNVIITGNGTIDCRGEELTNITSPIRLCHSKNILIENITLKNNGAFHYIESGGTDGLTIRNVKFKGQFATKDYNVSVLEFEAIQIEAVTEAGTGGAIPYDNTITKNVLIDGCYFGESEEGGKLYGAIGDHSQYTDKSFDNIMIKNCTFEKGQTSETNKKTLIGFTSNVNNLFITGNTFIDCDYISVDLCSKSNQGSITNLIMENNSFINQTFKKGTVNYYSVIEIGECYDGCISKNNFFKSDLQAIGLRRNIKNLFITNNTFYNVAKLADKTQDADFNLVGIMGSGNNLCIRNNIFSSTLDIVSKPIHIPVSSLTNYINLNIDNNVFYMNKFDINNYIRYTDKNEDVLFEGNTYYGTISFTNPINWYNEIDIIYSTQESVFSKRIKISHKSDTDPSLNNKEIVLKDFNLDNDTGSWTLYELAMLLDDNYLSGNIRYNIKNSQGNFSSKTDNVSDTNFAKIVKIVGYGRNNRIMINPLPDRIRAMISLKPQMVQEGVINDYNSYISELDTYEKSKQDEIDNRWEAYELALKQNSSLTYEEFIASYPSVIPNIEEPTIPQSVQEFMKKYL